MSSKITIKNTTSETWKEFKNDLKWGDWPGPQQPINIISPNSSVTIKCTGKGITGSEYTVWYSNGNQDFSIYCNNPAWSSNEFKTEISNGRYLVDSEGSTSGTNMKLTVKIVKPKKH